MTGLLSSEDSQLHVLPTKEQPMSAGGGWGLCVGNRQQTPWRTAVTEAAGAWSQRVADPESSEKSYRRWF